METRRIRKTSSFMPNPVSVQTRKSLDESSQIVRYNQCQQIEDKYYIVELTPYGNELLESLLPVLQQPNTIETAVYVYVIMSLGHKSPPTLYMMKTLNSYEIGTKHQQLINRISCIHQHCSKYVLYYAGEILKNPDDTIMFNFCSGTYMKDKLPTSLVPKGIEYVTNLINEITEHKYVVTFVDAPFITADTLPLSFEDLNMYVTCGATIRRFATKESCVAYKEFYNKYRFVRKGEKLSRQMADLLVDAEIYEP